MIVQVLLCVIFTNVLHIHLIQSPSKASFAKINHKNYSKFTKMDMKVDCIRTKIAS